MQTASRLHTVCYLQVQYNHSTHPGQGGGLRRGLNDRKGTASKPRPSISRKKKKEKGFGEISAAPAQPGDDGGENLLASKGLIL